jgi:hypothetical protein
MAARYWVALLVISLAVALAATAAIASSSRDTLTGTWSGSIERGPGGSAHRQHVLIVVDRSERGGSWKVNRSCGGRLRLKDISNGYHHYIEELSAGATCLGGGIDCLKRIGAGLYDEFQPQPATHAYYNSATFHRVVGA